MIIPVGYAQINLMFTGNAVPRGAQCTFGIIHAGSGLTTPAAVGDAIETEFSAADLDATYASEAQLSGILVKFGPNATGASDEWPTAIVGTLSSGAGNPSTSALVRKATATGGRKGRGRMYWPAVPETYVAPGGELIGGYVAQLQPRLDNFLAGLLAADIGMHLLHADATAPTPVISLGVQSVCANQRRRVRG